MTSFLIPFVIWGLWCEVGCHLLCDVGPGVEVVAYPLCDVGFCCEVVSHPLCDVAPLL